MKSDGLERAIYCRRNDLKTSWLLVALLFATATMAPLPALAQAANEIRVERLYVDKKIQQELPRAAASNAPQSLSIDGGTPPPASTREPTARDREEPPRRENQSPIFKPRPIGDPSPALNVLLWVLVTALAIIVLFHLSHTLFARAKSAVKTTKTAVVQAPVETVRGQSSATPPPLPPDPLSAAEALARAGKYDEAVHLVLLIAIEQLNTRFGRIAESLTSLEVARELPLRGDARPALATLVVLVERSHFGGRPLGEPDYRRGVKSFEDLISIVGSPS